MDELRSEYLFAFSRVCHMTPREVDAMRYVDFLHFILNIDAYYEALKKRASEAEDF